MKFMEAHKFGLTTERVDHNPNWMDSDVSGANWRCKVVSKDSGKQMTVYITMGVEYGIRPPTIEEVMSSIQLDVYSVVNFTFKQWCDELGYEVSSKRAKKGYLQCIKMSSRLMHILGQETFEEFINETDSL
jgi:hypothetical protein